jgi:hypothetical protein
MAATPLYKFLKSNGTSFYAFPGAAEDISAAYQNTNYKMYFSNYLLLNFPKQNLSEGTMSNPIYFDFENSFSKSVNAVPASNFSDSMVESLRNYVANQEVVIRESRLNNTQYYYDTNALETTSEKIFWKWCKKLGVIGFEPAIPEDEYFSNLAEFQSNNINDDEYFPEFIWKEREVTAWSVVDFYQTGAAGYTGYLEIQLEASNNFRVGDKVNIYDVVDTSVVAYLQANTPNAYDDVNGINCNVLNVIPIGATQGSRIIVDILYAGGSIFTGSIQAKVELVYNKLVQYIGNVTGVSNVQEANRSYTEIHAQIPDHTGQTPDILFRTKIDVNYKPNLVFPIIPNQYQPEIVGAESFNSPIVSDPNSFPGGYFGQFDTLDFTYETSTGDSIRRSGNYYGVSGNINEPVINGGSIDGLNIDLDRTHYVKMNILNRTLTNFEQFNALKVNNQPPKDFEFNSILWYYTVEDNNGNTRTNLYGISFLDNPINNPNEKEAGLRFPAYKKLVANGNQDGTSYSFSLLLNFNIINENIQESYNPEAINSMFSMNLFNSAMSKLSATNDNFLNIIAEQNDIRGQLSDLRSLLYTQTDINTINARINNLDNLLRLYSTNQIVESESIAVNQIPGTPPRISLSSIDPGYSSTTNILSTELYNAQGIIPVNINVPRNKDFLINLVNNDEVELELTNGDKLTIILDQDLYIRQTLDIILTANQFASQNKKLDIYMMSNVSGTASVENSNPIEILLVGDINLPVNFNTATQLVNSNYLWKDFKFDIDFDQSLVLNTGSILEVPFSGNTSIINNSFKVGDTFKMNNFFVGTQSVYDFSGQYEVSNIVGSTSSYVYFDVSSNLNLVAYGASSSLPLTIHSTSSTTLSNIPYFSLNKGLKIQITRVSDSSILSERYLVDIQDIK